MAWRFRKFRALSILTEDLSSVPGTDNQTKLQFQGIQCPLQIPASTNYACGTQIHTEAKHSCALNKKAYFFF